MKLLVLLSLLGLGAAFQVGKEYTYDYYSQIGLGIPEIREQVAAGGLKGKLKIQMITETQAYVKLDDVEVGEFHGSTDCGIHQVLPINFSPVNGVSKMLEEPFEVNIQFDKVGNVMVVPKSEPEYVINIKKAISHLFVMRPISSKYVDIVDIIETLARRSGDIPYLSIEGETFFGRCEVDYTLYPEHVMPTTNPKMMPQEIRTPWTLRKTINFERCVNKVVLQHNGVSNSTHAGSGGVGSVQTRSSISNYLVQPVDGGFEVRRGHSEGVVVLNPFGYNTEKLMSISNQTMVLKGVTEIQSKLVVRNPVKIVRSWQMEMSSPYKPGYNSPPWVNFRHKNIHYPPMLAEASITGLDINEELISTFESDVDKAITNAAHHITTYPVSQTSNEVILTPFDTPESTIAYELDSASRLVRALPLSVLEKLFETYKRDTAEIGQLKMDLFVDVCAASGGGAPLQLLIEKMSKKDIPLPRAMTIFMTLTNNIVSPEVLPSISKFIKTLSLKETDYKKFFLTSTAWINFASTIHRICLDRNSWSYSVTHQLYGDVNCSPTKGVEMLLPFLKEQLERSQEDVQRVVIAQAISNMGTSKSLSTLKQIIHGKYGNNTLLRTVALYGLLHYKMTDVSKHQIQAVLQPIIDNTEVKVELRQVALIVALSWHPSESWWNELASFSWQDPCQLMSSFIYSTMYSYARTSDPRLISQSRYAEYALRFAKPHTLFNKITGNYVRATYLSKDHMRTFFDIALIGSSTTQFPREMFAYLSNSFGGFEFSIFEIALSTEGIHPIVSRFLDNLQAMSPQEPSSRHPRDVSRAQFDDIIATLKEKLGMVQMPEEKPIVYIYTKYFQNIQSFNIVNKKIMMSILNEGKEMLRTMEPGKKMVMTKFVNPVTAEILLPTVIGVPIMTRITSPTIVSNQGQVSFKLGGSETTLMKGEIETNFKYVNKVITTLRVLLPWSSKLVSTGVENLKNINLPFKMGFKYEKPTAESHKTNMSLSLESVYDKEFPVIHKHNIPFTVLKRMWPGGDPKDINVKPVTVTGGNTLVTKVIAPIPKDYTGIDGQLIYHGDKPFPFTFGNLGDLIKRPSEIMKLFASPTSKAYQMVVRVNMGKSATSTLNASLALESMTKPTNEEIRPNARGKATLLLNGKELRYYESTLEHRTILTKTTKEYDTRSTIYRSALPGSQNQKTSVKYCFSSKVTQTYIYDIETLREALNSGNIKRTMVGKLEGGQTCKDNEIATFTGEASVSTPRIQRLKKEVNAPCMINKKQEFIDLRTELVYDSTKMEVKYIEKLPAAIYNASCKIYDVARGVAFPHIYFNYLDVTNAKQQIHLHGEKPLGQHFWHFSVNMPTENVILDKVLLPHHLQQIMNLNFFPMQSFTNKMIPLSAMDTPCRITSQKVKTYDGLRYDFPLKACWVVSAINMKRPEHEPIVLTRKDPSGLMQVMVTLPKVQVTLLLTKDQLKMNGEVIKLSSTPKEVSPSGPLVATAFKLGDEIIVEIPYKMIITVKKDSIEVFPLLAHQRGSQGGICGSYSSNFKYQFLGPKLSYYNDTTLFPHSWMLEEGQGCQREEVVRERRLVEDYQTKFHEIKRTIQLNKEEIPNDGLEYIYQVKRRDGVICISQQSIGMCLPGHSTKIQKVYMEVYNCWKDINAPEIVRKSEKRGYTKEHVNKPPGVTTSFETKHAVLCSH